MVFIFQQRPKDIKSRYENLTNRQIGMTSLRK